MRVADERKMLEVVKRGGDLNLAAEALGITVRALQAELANDEALADKVESARDYAVEKAILGIYEAAHEGNLTAAKFIAERRRPDEWAQVSGPAVALNFGAGDADDLDISALHARLAAIDPAPKGGEDDG